jgi:hypothetical protein
VKCPEPVSHENDKQDPDPHLSDPDSQVEKKFLLRSEYEMLHNSVYKSRVVDPHHFHVDPCLDFTLMRIRIQLFTLMRIWLCDHLARGSTMAKLEQLSHAM